MANKERGELILDVDGQPYTLKLTINTICEMEALSGRTFDQILANLRRGSMSDLRLFLWAGLQTHHKDLTLIAVGDLIEAAGGPVGLQAQLEAFIKLQQDEGAAPAAGGKKKRTAPPVDGTGASSTLTRAG